MQSWQRDHDPRVLWPDLDRRAFDAAIDQIMATAQRVLAGERAVALALPGVDAPTMGRAAFRLGAGALLGHWIAAGAIAAPGDVAAVLATHLDHGRRRHARLATELARLLHALRSEGIEAGVLKGLDSARFYPESGARVSADIDLFVHPDDSESAMAVLQRLGFVSGLAVPGRRHEWELPGQTLQSLDFTHTDNPWRVDLHWRLGRIYHRALVGELPVFDPRTCPTATLGSESVPVLPPEARLAFLALHASTSIRMLLLSHLTDIVLAARATAPPSSDVWAAMGDVLDRCGSTRFAYPPLVLAHRLAPDAVPTHILDTLGGRVSARLRRATARLPLTGMAPPDKWRLGYVMLWVTTPRDAWRVLVQALKFGRFRGLRWNIALARRAIVGLLRGATR